MQGLGVRPACVVDDVGVDHEALEVVAEVEDVVFDAELIGHAAGVVDVADRATTRVAGSAPELHGDADDLVAGSAASRAAATDESTPPDMATSTFIGRTPATVVGSRHHVQGVVDVGIGARPPEREPDRSEGDPAGHTHGCQHVGRVLGAAGTRRSGRCEHIVAFEQHEQGFGLDLLDGHVARARHLVRSITVGAHRRLGHAGHRCNQAVGEAIAERADPGHGGSSGVDRGSGRGSHGHDSGHVLRSTATVALLAPTDRLGRQGHAGSHRQRTYALRTAELVRADRDQIGPLGQAGHVEPAEGLDCVGVQPGSRGQLGNDVGHRVERLDDPGLVVDQHHRDEGDRVVEGFGQCFEVDQARRLDTHNAPATVLDRVQHGVMFGGGAHHGSAVATVHTHDGQVVGLGTARSEDHVAGSAAETLGQHIACVVDGPARITGQAVRARRVPVGLGHGRNHGRDGLGADRGGRGMIEVGVRAAHPLKVRGEAALARSCAPGP